MTIRLKDAVEIWLSQQISTTRKSYYYPIKAHMDYVGEQLPLDAITPVHIATYSEQIKQRDYATKTLYKHISTVKTFWNWCLKMDFVEKSPARILKKPKVQRKVSDEKALPAKDIGVLLEYLKQQTHKTNPEEHAVATRNYAIFTFLAETGARVGGAASLKVNDLWLEDLHAYTTEKGSKRLKKAFTEECANAFRAWLLCRPNTDSGNRHVFISMRYYKPLSGNYIAQIMRRTAEAIKQDWGYELQNKNPHALRHSLALRMWADKIAPSRIAGALGHSRIETTIEHYAPNDWEGTAEAVRSLAITPQRPPNQAEKLIKISG
jgi:integrase/recombinase XerD